MSKPPCYCDSLPFPHRFTGDCDYYVSKEEYAEDGRTAEDDRLDSPQHNQAAFINRETRERR